MNTFSNSDILNSGWSLPPLDSANIAEFTNSLSIYANVSGIVTKYYFPGPQNYYDRFLNRWYRVERGQLWSMTLETYASIGFGSIVMPEDEQLGVLRDAVKTPFNNGSSSYFLIILPSGEYLQVAEVTTYTTAGSRVMIGSSDVFCLSVLWGDTYQIGPQQAVDDDITTIYHSENYYPIEFLGIRLPTDDIAKISVVTRQDTYSHRWIGSQIIVSLYNTYQETSSQKFKTYFNIPFDPPGYGFAFYFSSTGLSNVKTVNQDTQDIQALILDREISTQVYEYEFYIPGIFYRFENSHNIYQIINGKLYAISVDIYAAAGFGLIVGNSIDTTSLYIIRQTLNPTCS
jgi:hypothetical protein